MKTFVIQITVLLCFLTGCSGKKSTTAYDPKIARSIIATALPSGWKILSPPSEQSKLTTAYFDHSQAEAFLVVGTQLNQIDWSDHQGLSHSEELAKECLYVWVVPSDFKPAFPQFGSYMYFFGPELPQRIYSSRGVRIYGFVSQQIVDTNRFDTIMKEATMISSPPLKLSWANWEKDIPASLDK